jgi:hypothetical protein
MAAVRCASSRRSAMRWRMRVMGTRSSGREPEAMTGAAGATLGADVAGAGAGAAVLAAANTSSLMTRPSRPLPAICAGSTPCSAASLRAAGLAGTTARTSGMICVGSAGGVGSPTAVSSVASRSPECTVAPSG